MIRIVSLIIALLPINSTFSEQYVLDEEKLKHHSGFFDFYYSKADDKIYLEVKNLDSAFLYISSLSEGIASNDLILDRGQIGGT